MEGFAVAIAGSETAQRASEKPVLGSTGTSGPGVIRIRTTPRPEVAAPPFSTPAQGRIVTFFMTTGASGRLMPPSGPAVVGVAARASTTSSPFVTLPKIT